MDLIQQIISNLSKDEIRYYKLYNNLTHSDIEKKEVKLFNLIKEKEKYSPKEACEKLSSGNRNNFYQLKNKTIKSINKSLSLQHMHKEKDLHIFNDILLSRIFKRKGDLDLSLHYLKKAEKKSHKNENFEIISIVYSEILKLSYDLVSIDIDKYLKKARANKEKLDLEQEIDLTLSSIMYEIKTSQNLHQNKTSLLNILEKKLNHLHSNKKIIKSRKFRISIFKSISRILLQKNDYISLEKYLKDTYEDFLKDKIFNKQNHEQKLMLITYLTNSLYKNGKLKESLFFAEELKKSMKEYENLLKEKYLFYYYNALVINYSKLDKLKAIDILKEAKKNSRIQSQPTFSVFIYLNTALLYYDLNKFKLSIKHISRLILHEDFISLSTTFQLKILISELIIRQKLKQSDSVEEKIKNIKNLYKKDLKIHKREKAVLSIITKLIYCNNIYLDKDLQKEIYKTKEMITNKEAENIDVINYNTWLESLTKQSIA